MEGRGQEKESLRPIAEDLTRIRVERSSLSVEGYELSGKKQGGGDAGVFSAFKFSERGDQA